MSRTGKIARLPHDIREQLNRRLRDGQSGSEILQWVNELPECRQMLAEKFGGRPIDDNNLYEWRYGGYGDWLCYEDRRDRLAALFENIAKFEAAGDVHQFGEQLSVIAAAELARALNLLDGVIDMNDHWYRLRQICRELSRFRHENYNQQRLRLAEQRYELERQRQNERRQPENTTNDQSPPAANTIRLDPANSG